MSDQSRELESRHVHEVYEAIAPHFSSTRFSRWPKVSEFINTFEKGSLLGDVGCGNGKYLGVNKQVYTLGCDRSLNLVNICAKKGEEVLRCDILDLPYRSNVFDGVICIAVIHHLSDDARRLASIREMIRMIRPGGKVLVYVWAYEQDGRNQGKYTDQDAYIPWKLPRRFRGKESAQEDKEVTEYKRYYHLFKENELGELVSPMVEENVCEISEIGYDHQNWYIILNKL